ncbi:phosphomannomutase/phosphoglucomutase [Candidatus Woesearchaeota archaeon]|nr:phosphomannomutase/phosphoglucomutase [Candidatus Woesearchaeota archaeon]
MLNGTNEIGPSSSLGSHRISELFKAYDIRGIFGEALTEEIAYRIGRAIVKYLSAEKVLVGRDMRTSSIPLRDALVRGITEQGADVVDIGLCSTPMFYWATQGFKAGVMVTASHNPGKYNGFKICKDGAFPVGESTGMKEIQELVIKNVFPESKIKGEYSKQDVLDQFLEFNLSFLKTRKKFKIVIDAGNGMGGYVYGELLKKLPDSIKIIAMYFEPDGTFPNHEANPLKTETLRELQARVVEEDADLGIALDGDEDRIVFVDNKGDYIASDYTTALLAEEILAEHPGATILYDIRQSRVTPDAILALGGKPIMTRVGHSLIKAAMREHKAPWGGEFSGHFYNAEQQNTENTQIIMFRMLNLLAGKNATLEEVSRPLRTKYAKIDETNTEVSNPDEVIALLDAAYSQSAQSVSRIDGIRVDFADWWFNVRKSNTEPLLRLNLEAISKDLLQQKAEELLGIIKGERIPIRIQNISNS